MFFSAIWEIWCSRNRARFDDKPMVARQILHRVMMHVSDAQKFYQPRFFDLSAPHRSFLQQWGVAIQMSTPLAPKLVRWYLPRPGRLKLNVDGAFKSTSFIAAGGGILRDHMGNIIFAFSAIYQGVCSSLEAEALALRNGIILCYEKGISYFLIESDSLVLVQMMKGNYSIPWHLSIITQDILYRCQHIHVSLSHIYREANQVADTLAGPLVSTLLDLVSTHCPKTAQMEVMKNQWSPMGQGKSDEHPPYG
ncbi:hypothetical protein Taro_026721 [Colocasia esculenta]|uniref:RNase H type-1 domain-containing protein n=1 Tax=Colocasia esculenta TaxID=4460 RepID=A0A843VKD8_COLES|nr:hypothetical protein [Colocasia esculenta]